jgi:thiol-disulfide isomerase/thioredoxin
MHRKALTLAAAGALLMLVGCAGCESDPPPQTGGDEPEDAPFLVEFTAERIDGGEVSLSDFEGEVVLVDLFGTWCPPCRRATPYLVSLYERYRDRDFEIVGLAYEREPRVEDKKEAVRGFRREFDVPYILALGPNDIWQQLPDNRGALPTVLLVDRVGVVRKQLIGLQPGEEAVLADTIEKLLNEPRGASGP